VGKPCFCHAGLSSIFPNKSEGFPTSGNDEARFTFLDTPHLWGGGGLFTKGEEVLKNHLPKRVGDFGGKIV